MLLLDFTFLSADLYCTRTVEFLHDVQQFLWHEVRTAHDIVLVAIFAKADKDRLKGHLKNGNEAVDD